MDHEKYGGLKHLNISEVNSTAGIENTSHQHIQSVNGNNITSLKESPLSKQYRAATGKRVLLSPILQANSSAQSLRSHVSSASSRLGSVPYSEDEIPQSPNPGQTLFNQVLEWLQQEKAKRANPKLKESADNATSAEGVFLVPHRKIKSQNLEDTFALDKLEKILRQYIASKGTITSPNLLPKHAARHCYKGLQKGSASDSENSDWEVGEPRVDAILDNSKICAYTNDVAKIDTDHPDLHVKHMKDKENWLLFKAEILRLTHTLQLKGWRKIPVTSSGEIEVTRLSGALTNAVYVITPPRNLFPRFNGNDGAILAPRRHSPKLLLRIYRPQVAHLIDREKELQILRRLKRQNIGPRVLGTFNNGRFEEFFHAQTLTPKDLRTPETSRQIAKRMRELHDGVELLDEERTSGSTVFKNWDKWVEHCEKVVTWLDKEIVADQSKPQRSLEPRRKTGFVCGVPWPTFRKAVERYRKWLTDTCSGIYGIKKQLVFAHNDTQYGNLLRLEPSDESPLHLPAKEHKQLIVIDFEYASANTPGSEFANHFSEWCYNYHDSEKPWACKTIAYPTPEEQHRFISAYVYHQSHLGGPSFTSPLPSPDMQPSLTSTPRLAPFSIGAPVLNPEWSGYPEADKDHEDSLEAEIQSLTHQARLWRAANSAQWVAWGILQAKVPGMGEEIQATSLTTSKLAASTSVDANPGELEEFDYLAYAQDRAAFFWADVLSLGLISEGQLPMELLLDIKAKSVPY